MSAGSSAVYDESLAYLNAHRDRCLEEYNRLRSLSDPTPAQRSQMDNLEVDAYVNDPATRALFRSTKGTGQMDRPVMRHLAERRWRHEGGLDVIMGRVYQNKVVPDVLPDIAPLLPFSLAIPAGTVEPGLIIEASTLAEAPVLKFQPFQHPAYPTATTPHPAGLYTLVGINADEPDTVNRTYSERLHYLKTDIPLSITSGEVDIIRSAGGTELVSWEPVAPAQNTGRHRIVFVLLRQIGDQPSKLDYAPKRDAFSLRSLMATCELPLNAITAVNLVRTEWTEESKEHIDGVWKEHRGRGKAPVYRPVQHDEVFSRPRSSIGQKVDDLRERAYDRKFEEYQRELDEVVAAEAAAHAEGKGQ